MSETEGKNLRQSWPCASVVTWSKATPAEGSTICPQPRAGCSFCSLMCLSKTVTVTIPPLVFFLSQHVWNKHFFPFPLCISLGKEERLLEMWSCMNAETVCVTEATAPTGCYTLIALCLYYLHFFYIVTLNCRLKLIRLEMTKNNFSFSFTLFICSYVKWAVYVPHCCYHY